MAAGAMNRYTTFTSVAVAVSLERRQLTESESELAGSSIPLQPPAWTQGIDSSSSQLCWPLRLRLRIYTNERQR